MRIKVAGLNGTGRNVPIVGKHIPLELEIKLETNMAARGIRLAEFDRFEADDHARDKKVRRKI